MTSPNGNVRDFGVSLIRTYVPMAWAAVITWSITQVPALEPVLNQPGVAGFAAALTGVVLVAWYGVMRVAEKHLPPWLTRIVLGANATPSYRVPDALPERQYVPRSTGDL